ncbi:MAG: BACON domain-containing protein [Thermoanaerobaculia bacterium]
MRIREERHVILRTSASPQPETDLKGPEGSSTHPSRLCRWVGLVPGAFQNASFGPALLLACVLPLVLTAAEPVRDVAEFEEIASIGFGEEESDAGLRHGPGGPFGPMAMGFDQERGLIHVVDTQKNRILSYSLLEARWLPALPLGAFAEDIVLLSGGRIAAYLPLEGKVACVESNGASCGEQRIPHASWSGCRIEAAPPSSVIVIGTDGARAMVSFEDAVSSADMLPSHLRESPTVLSRPPAVGRYSDGEWRFSLTATNGRQTIVPLRGRTGEIVSARVAGWAPSSALLDLEEISSDGGHSRRLVLTGADGRAEYSAFAPANAFAPVVRDLAIGADRTALVMIVTEDRLRIIRLRLEAEEAASAVPHEDSTPPYDDVVPLVYVTAAETEVLTPPTTVPPPAERPASYTQVELLQRASAYANASYTPLSPNLAPTGMPCLDVNGGQKIVTTPSNLQAGVVRQGIPYKWGGDSPILGVSTPFAGTCSRAFSAALAEGGKAGDVNTATDYGACCATGVDCSGFLQQVWGVNVGWKLSTGGLADLCCELATVSELLPGDMIYKSATSQQDFAHVALVASPGTALPLSVYESSGYDWKVSFNAARYTAAALLTYRPFRSPVTEGLFAVGDRVESLDSLLSRRTCAGTSCTSLGTVPKGTKGTIVGGPSTTVDWRVWWQILWDDTGTSAWSYQCIKKTAGTASAPAATTGAASSIGETTAALNGTVNPNGASTTTGFQYGTTTGYGDFVPAAALTGSTAQSISAPVSGLLCNTTYHYRATATNSVGTSYGFDATFTTGTCPASAPAVTTGSATGVGQTTATLNGTVNPNGASTTTGFQYGTTTSYGSSVPTATLSGSTAQSISAYVSGLVCSTTYHFRATGTSSAGTGYGSDATFTTGACPASAPAVTTGSATGVGQTTAALNGTVNPNGASAMTGFQYGATTSYGSVVSAATLNGSATQPISASVSSLLCNSTYHFRATGTSPAGTSYGSDSTFTTASCAGTVGSAQDFVDVTGATTQLHRLAVAPDGSIYVLFPASGGTGLKVVRSTDGGASWAAAAAIPSSAFYNDYFDFVVDPSGNLHVVWTGAGSGGSEVYYSRGTFAGTIFSPPVAIRTGTIQNGYRTGNAITPKVDVSSNGIVLVAFSSYTATSGGTFAGYNIWYSQSSDGGMSFSPEIPVNVISSAQKAAIRVRASGSNVFVLYSHDMESDLFVARRDATGTWATGSRVNLTAGKAYYSVADMVPASDGATVFVAYMDVAVDPEGEITTCRSTNGGATWSGCSRVNDSSTRLQENPAIDIDSAGGLHVAWADLRSNSTFQTYYAESLDGGLSFSANVNVSLPFTAVNFHVNRVTVDKARSVTYVSASREGPQVVLARLTDSTTCSSFIVSPSTIGPTEASGSAVVSVTGSPSGCSGGSWTASGNGSWLSVSPTSGTGSGSVTVSWLENTSTSARTGNVTIAGTSVSVSQPGAAVPTCGSFSISPSTTNVSAVESSALVTVTGEPSGCVGGSWTAAGNGSWVSVSPTSGTGPSGTVTVSWTQNGSTSPRSATVTVAGRGFMVTQAGSTPPLPTTGATVYVSEWQVATNGTTGGDIPYGFPDTIVRLANPSGAKVLAKVELWSRAGIPALGFMVPLRAGDNISFRMRDVLNGQLNVNSATQVPGGSDACSSASWYAFQNPDLTDRQNSVSIYAVPAFSGSFRRNVWDLLDDNPGDGVFTGTFRGSLTVDVVNFCTGNHPAAAPYYTNDALATLRSAGANLLTGSADFEDQMGTWPATVHLLAFDPTLNWNSAPTFYDRFFTPDDPAFTPASVPSAFRFTGDGRQPLPAAACVFAIDQPSSTAGSASGAAVVGVDATPAGCSGSWSATANATWLSVSPASGSGSANVTVSWAANSGAPRAGTVTIAGQVHTVSQAAAPSYLLPLVVGRLGNGAGLVSSSPAGISCGSACSASFTAGSSVTLTASPSAGSRFAGWAGGGCSGTADCTVAMNAAKTVSATFLPTASNRFYSITPCRVVDTRNATGPLGGPALSATDTRAFTLGGTCNVPADAAAVSLNATVADATAPGSLTIYPGTGPAPGTNTITFVPGKNRANNVTMGLIGGTLSVVDYQATGTVNLIVDVNGYYR